MEHPKALAQAGKSGPVRMFARKGGADYGLVVMNGATPTGHAFANFLLGEEGRRILASQGFSPPEAAIMTR